MYGLTCTAISLDSTAAYGPAMASVRLCYFRRQHQFLSLVCFLISHLSPPYISSTLPPKVGRHRTELGVIETGLCVAPP